MGSSSVEFTITRTSEIDAAQTFNYSIRDIGTDSSDYQAASGTLSFSANETTQTLLVNILGDDVFEEDETFQLLLTDSNDASNTNQNQANSGRGTIIDDEQRPTLTIAPTTAPEDGATIDFIVNLSHPADRDLLYTYIVEPATAVSGVDFEPITGTLNIPAFEMIGFINVPLGADDNIFGVDKVLTITVTDRGDDSNSVTAQGTIIEASDAPVITAISLQRNGVESDSSNSPLEFRITRSRLSETSQSLSVIFSGTADALDYDNNANTVTFAPDQLQAILSVDVLQDAIYEDNETVTASANGVSADGDIIDDEDLPEIVSIVPINDGAENGADIVFEVTRSGLSKLDQSIQYVAGLATDTADAADFTDTLGGNVTFAAGSLTEVVSLAINDDLVFEGAESLTLLSALDPAVNGLGNIQDDESVPFIQSVISSGNTAETTGGTVISFDITRSSEDKTGQSFTYGLSGTATNILLLMKVQVLPI